MLKDSQWPLECCSKLNKCSPLLSLAILHSVAFIYLVFNSREYLFWTLKFSVSPQCLCMCYAILSFFPAYLSDHIILFPLARFSLVISFNVWCFYHPGFQRMVIFSTLIATRDCFLYDYLGEIYIPHMKGNYSRNSKRKKSV